MKWRNKKVDHDLVARLAPALGVSTLVAGMLVRRGISDEAGAEAFLNPGLKDLPAPSLLPDMDQAVSALIQALDQGRAITVYGDYDADGLTSTALLTGFLERLGARVSTYIPHRTKEGYGLNQAAVEALASSGTDLIVTVDCGVSDFEAVSRARELGIDVIVTDHHQPPPRLPPAVAVINPKRSGSRFPQRELAGVGVAFFLAGGLRQALRDRGQPSPLPELAADLGLVAIGTVADVAPLVGVNRILVRQGLAHLVAPGVLRPGLAALKEVSALEADGPVTARDVAFRLAPRLNAAGRLGSARPGLELLMTRDPEEAKSRAATLERLNHERRRLQDKTYQEALAIIEESRIPGQAIILANSGWHRGIVGLAAAKLVEAFHLPAILLALEDGLARGSGRSMKGFNLFRALSECQDIMLRFGGHDQAAGLTVAEERFEELARHFIEVAGRELSEADLAPCLDIEAEVGLDDLAGPLAGELAWLAPYGEGNPEPVLAVPGINVLSAGCVGASGQHLRLVVARNGRHMDLMGFGLGARLPEIGRRLDLAVQRHSRPARGRIAYGWKIIDFRPKTDN